MPLVDHLAPASAGALAGEAPLLPYRRESRANECAYVCRGSRKRRSTAADVVVNPAISCSDTVRRLSAWLNAHKQDLLAIHARQGGLKAHEWPDPVADERRKSVYSPAKVVDGNAADRAASRKPLAAG